MYPLSERARILSVKPAIQPLPTCADGTTEHTEDEGENISYNTASALCQTGNNDDKSWNFPSFLYQREIILSLGNGLKQNCMIGIGINWYKPWGLQDWGKIF